MMLKITVKTSGFDRVRHLIPDAIAAGLNEGGDKVRSSVRVALKAQTGVKSMASITSRTLEAGVGSNRAAVARLVYAIPATGKGIPIGEFPVGLTAKGVVAKTWGVDHLFKRSFGIPGSSGPAGFRARRGADRFPIRNLYGPALPKEIARGDTARVFLRDAALYVPPAVLRRLAQVLR